MKCSFLPLMIVITSLLPLGCYRFNMTMEEQLIFRANQYTKEKYNVKMTECGDFFVAPPFGDLPGYYVEWGFAKGKVNRHNQNDNRWGQRTYLSMPAFYRFIYRPSGEIFSLNAFEVYGKMNWPSEEEMREEKPFSIRQKHIKANATLHDAPDQGSPSRQKHIETNTTLHEEN